MNLSYRCGYFATAEGNSDPKASTSELHRASFEAYLDATSVTFFARSFPADSPQPLRYLLAIVPSAISFTPTTDGQQHLRLTLAVCTFDKSGKPLQFLTAPIEPKIDAKEYQSILATPGFPHLLEIAPNTKPSSIRVLIKDEPTGRLGSVNLPLPIPTTAEKTQPAFSGQ